jgi:hypothetical protein
MPVSFILKTFQKILIILILNLFCFQLNILAQDTLSVTKPVKHRFHPETMKATMMSVAFPGLGQIYNRKYWKIPLVYAGFGGLAYYLSYNSSNYDLYMKAYQDFTDKKPETQSYIKLIAADPSTYDPVLFHDLYVPSQAKYFQDGMLRTVDYYKRYRDLSYIGLGVWYMMSILDANVDASLFDYDISDNLDIAVFPALVPLPGGFTGAGLNVGIKVIF